MLTVIAVRQWMHVSECLCLGLYWVYAHCLCCKVMDACVRVSVFELVLGVCSLSLLQGNGCMCQSVCVWACTRCMLTVFAAR
jgi:hypothetical protein